MPAVAKRAIIKAVVSFFLRHNDQGKSEKKKGKKGVLRFVLGNGQGYKG
jgi:hypothetical protein